MTSAQQETVFLRIKRFGKEWATCGIGVIPPAGQAHDPRMKKLCPKLVPGQVIELPVTHPLVKKRNRLVEEVDGPEKDEFLRPWVFHSAEEAAMANPSKSRLGPAQILDGLTMRAGAIENAPKHRRKAREKMAKEFGGKTPSELEQEPEPVYDEDDAPMESPEQVAKRAQNRAPRDELPEKAEAPEVTETPRRRQRRSRS